MELRLEALVWTRPDLDLAYEADAHAFALAPEDRADAFDFAADAFEEARAKSAAEMRPPEVC